jgi:SAM-dependent methyltransferase
MSTLCEQYDEDYFERGPQTGKSLYENYSWLPELTLPMCHYLIQHMGLRTGDWLLDYGCAKGFTIRGLRLLGIQASGCDISRYAIEHCDPEVKPYVCLMEDTRDPSPWIYRYRAMLSKDTLEHLPLAELKYILQQSRLMCEMAFHVVPLAEDGKYICPEYELDVTHILRYPHTWWIDRFEEAGWKLKNFAFAMPGIKENWTSKYPRGNGFFLLEQ